MKNRTTVIDALQNAAIDGPENYGRGIVVGVVAAIMGQTGCLFQDALNQVKELKPDIKLENIPDAWVEDWVSGEFASRIHDGSGVRRLRKYRTAFSPLFGKDVSIAYVRADSGGGEIIHCRIDGRPMLFRPHELRDFRS